MALQEFTSAEEMRAHYKAVKARLWTQKPPEKPSEVIKNDNPAPVVIPIVEVGPSTSAAVARLMVRVAELEDRVSRLSGSVYGPLGAVNTQKIDYSALRREVPQRFCSITEVQAAVCRIYGISLIELVSHYQGQPTARFRHIAIHLCRKLTIKSGPEIGRMFGDRDHTTVLSAHRKITRLRQADSELDAELTAIENALSEAAKRGEQNAGAPS